MRFSLFALALLTPNPALAQESAQARAVDWQPLPSPGGNSMLSISWDRGSVVREADLARATVRVSTTMIAGGGHGDFLFEIRCSDSRSRVIRSTNYTPAGAPLVEESPRARFERIRPGTYVETLRAAIC